MVRRLRAPNPSPMTLSGTNGYIVDVGPGALVAIDPGIDDAAHIAAFQAAAHERHARYAAILVTHGHPDHYPGALALRRETGTPVFAHPAAGYGADRALADGQELIFEDAAIRAIYAPGHARDHLVFWVERERALFTGDVVIGTGTVVIAPPGGDMRAYQATLERLEREYAHADAIYGGHGPTVRNVREKLAEYIAHRRAREAQVLEALAAGSVTIPELVTTIYAAVDPQLWPAASRQIEAYLIALTAEGRVSAERTGREPTNDERRLLAPDLSLLATDAERELVRAELGVSDTPELLRYSLR